MEHRDCWCCTLHWSQLHFLGEKCTWIHSSLGITGTNRYTGRKTDCLHPGWLHTTSVTRSSSHSLLCFHYIFVVDLFFHQLHKNPPFWIDCQTADQSWSFWMWNGNMQSKELIFILRLGFTQCFLYWKIEEEKWCCVTSHGCPISSSRKSVSPETEKGRRQQLIILCGAICNFISWCTPWLVENHSWQTQNLPCFQKVHL